MPLTPLLPGVGCVSGLELGRTRLAAGDSLGQVSGDTLWLPLRRYSGVPVRFLAPGHLSGLLFPMGEFC